MSSTAESQSFEADYLAKACPAARWIVSHKSERHWVSRLDKPPDEQFDLYH